MEYAPYTRMVSYFFKHNFFKNNSYVWKPTALAVDTQQSREASCANYNDTSEFILQIGALPSYF